MLAQLGMRAALNLVVVGSNPQMDIYDCLGFGCNDGTSALRQDNANNSQVLGCGCNDGTGALRQCNANNSQVRPGNAQDKFHSSRSDEQHLHFSARTLRVRGWKRSLPSTERRRWEEVKMGNARWNLASAVQTTSLTKHNAMPIGIHLGHGLVQNWVLILVLGCLQIGGVGSNLDPTPRPAVTCHQAKGQVWRQFWGRRWTVSCGRPL